MKFTADRYDVPIVTGYGPDWIAVDGERIDDSVLISSLGAREAWNCAALNSSKRSTSRPCSALASSW